MALSSFLGALNNALKLDSADGDSIGRSRRLWWLTGGASILAVALVVFFWPGGDGDGDGPLNAIARAAERTKQEPGGRAVMRATYSSPGRSDSRTITGRLVFNDETDRGLGILMIPRPGASGPARMEVVGSGSVIYMRSDLFGSLPDGREWMSVDLSFAEASDSPLPANTSAEAELELLESVGGEVEKLGREDVNGVPTTRYRGTVSAVDNAERLRKAGADDLASEIEDLGAPVRVETWIDADHRVRRMRIVSSQPGESVDDPTKVDMRMTFFDFGAVPEIEVPDPSDVFDATDLVEEKAGISNS